METIRVNMTPCEDVQTIHASQNDNEAREWGFELHNNGEKIDSSSISDQLVFKAYKGGTEQILPTNGSTPTTSPFKGDIKYPKGLLSDQEFLYRESPTEEDGLAKITDIKGNTLVWNQLVENGNFESTDGWRFPNGTASVSNNVLTVNATGSSLQIMRSSNYTSTQGHKIYISCWIKSSVAKNDVRLRISQDNPLAHTQYISKNLDANVRTNISGIITAESNTTNTRFSIFVLNSASGEVYTVDSFVAFDLTQMGLDISSPSDFASLFPLSYYSYNQGSLLSFNGNGIKTVGKNRLKMPSSSTLNGISFNVGTDGQIQITGTATAQTDFYMYGASGRYDDMGIMSSTYMFSCRKDSTTTGLNFFLVGQQTGTKIGMELNNTFLFQSQPLDGSDKYRVFLRVNNGTTINTKVALQLELGASATDYEPYTSTTTSLPISTYFPTGMKSVPSAYDELTPSKAITRVGSVDLGTLTYAKEPPVSAHPDWPLFYASVPGALGKYSLNGNTQICAKYSNRGSINWNDKEIGFGGLSTNINIADTAFADYTVEQVKEALSGVMLYYKLATQTETSFSTASLVTENAEIPLSNEDGVLIGKCTEELSAEPGFHDAKIKLSDADGECYSNKIQLHVERKPS